jgi:hypothetical protein
MEVAMRRLVLPVFALTVLAAWQPGAPKQTEEQKAEIAATVDSLTNEWWSAWAVFDVDRGASFIYDGPGMTWASDGYRTLYSVAEAKEVWVASLAGLQRQDLEVTNSRTVVLAEDIVWTLREFNYVVVDTSGTSVAEGQFKETAVWVKRNGEWKVMLGNDNDATPTE